jgi:23S rRNA (adenine2030-N6)-methyltransferase
VLSYRHAFHAGNFADILKHLVLCSTLHYASRKEAPLFFLDTHAGAGLYRLNAPEAKQTGEAGAGILKLDFETLFRRANDSGKSAVQIYHGAVEAFLKRQQYPGSPLIAAGLLRRQDHLHLCELHPTDYRMLSANTGRDKRITIEQVDGFLAINALLPPVQKRAVILIDPSYELKQDYLQVVRALVEIHRRMPAAQVLLWYPVVERAQTDKLFAGLLRSGLHDLWQFELGLAPDSEGHGMSASGMLVLNPPWTLANQLTNCLPLVLQQLAPDTGHWVVRNLVGE